MLLPRAAFGASPKPLFVPQTFREEAKKRAAGATRFLLGLDDVLVSARGHGVQRGLAAGGAHAAVIQQRPIHRRERHDILHLELDRKSVV